MARAHRIPPEFEPRLVAISSTMDEDGLLNYVTTTQRNGGERIKMESWGYARPQCQHEACRWVNLARAAEEWGWLALPQPTGGVLHPDQLAFKPLD